ncbi:MAG TPA: hypothetical protein VK348_04015, partial [Planctomycetota bacterium]|nr:hypothetical protein [Planctomycetota bacterium]
HDPYTTTVSSLATDPRMAEFAKLGRWNGWVMPYGPVSALLQWLFAAIPSPWVGAYLWKLLMAAAHVATAWFVFATLRTLGDERDARRGFVLWLWNPWLLLESCGSGHNDALQTLLLAMMCAALAQGRVAQATAGYGYSLLVKHGSAPLGPLLLGHAILTRRAKPFAVGVLVTLVAVLASWFVWFREPGALDFLARQSAVDRASVSSFAAALFGEAMRQPVQVFGLLLTLLVLAQGFLRAKDPTSIGRWSILAMAVFVLVAVPNFAPWYHYWWLPLFALGQLPVLARVIELLAWVGPFSYLVWVTTRSLGIGHQAWQFLLAGLWPFLLLLLDWRSLAGMKKKSVASGDDEAVAEPAHKH